MQKEIGWLLEEKYNNKPTEKFYRDVKRLEAEEPVDYVIGFTEFLGCKIDLSKKPLIPRPETEYWVSEALKKITVKKPRILDIFAGSGCIGLAILKHIKGAQVTFADKQKYFNNPHFVKSDVFSNIKEKYDYIFANPPYIPTARKNKIQESVLRYEPKMALFSGKDGLFCIREFLRDAQSYLNADGKIFMEFDSIQKKEIGKLIKKYNYKNCEFHRDQYNKWRWIEIGG